MTAQQTAVLAALAQVLGMMPATAKISRKAKAEVGRKAKRTPEKLLADMQRASTKQGNVAPVVPHVNVLTFKAWAEKGRKVIPLKEGGKGGLPGFGNLFHEEQTRPVA